MRKSPSTALNICEDAAILAGDSHGCVEDSAQIRVDAFYKFVELLDTANIREWLLPYCKTLGLRGTILLAREGVNGSLAGTEAQLVEFWNRIEQDPRFRNVNLKINRAEKQPFLRMKVRLKNEIIRMNRPDLGSDKAGTYIDPKDWDALIADPGVVLVDTRNRYEVALGTFEGAVDPDILTFTELPEWVEKHLDPTQHKKVAMFCTGGIRCEKSTALMKELGFEDVYHLKGGILQYLEDTQNQSGKWKGQCFVFDGRTAVDADLAPSQNVHCRNCGRRLDSDDLKFAARNEIYNHCALCDDSHENK